MIVNELLANDENIKETFYKDAIGRNADIYKFINLLNSIENTCVIALDSYWGSGKTFFVKQLHMILKETNSLICDKPDNNVINTWNNIFQNRFEMIPQLPIYYDAWANDNDEDPILSILYQVLKEYSMLSDSKDDIGFKDIAKLITDIADAFFDKPVLKSIKSLLDMERKDFLADIKNEKKKEELVREFLEKIKIEKGNRIVIFIDELDRCRPDYAVKLLERVKHYFSCNDITFVFSVNIAELQHTIKKYYGEAFDACRYLDRFFDLRITMPVLKKEKFFSYIGFADRSYIFDKVVLTLVSKYNMEMREIIRYVKICNIAAYNPTHNKKKYSFDFSEEKGYEFILMTFVPLIIGLRMQDMGAYMEFIKGKKYEIFEEIMLTEDCKYISQHYLLAINETFDEPRDENTIKVNRCERLKLLYDAIFNTEYNGRYYETKIGAISIIQRSKEVILETISLMSNYSDFSL